MPAQTFNPCDLEKEDEQPPAKIWELLRRNPAFRVEVERLRELDSRVQLERAGGTYHGPAWNESWRLIEDAKEDHPFAGIALKWLVPEPLMIITRFTASKDDGSVHREVCEIRPQDLAAPESWPWWDANKSNMQGRLLTRGPEIHFHEGNIRRFCDRRIFLNEWRGWKPGEKMFDCDTPWPSTPAGFRNYFQFIWRHDCDASANNPFSGTRTDSFAPHETDFFKGWNLQDFPASNSSSLSTEELGRVIRFNQLADARVFAFPRTILTKHHANAMGAWVAEELKRGLPNDREMLGTHQEWRDWLSVGEAQPPAVVKETHYYRRRRYLDGLASQIYPEFNIQALLAPPKHRARGKKYVPKGRQI